MYLFVINFKEKKMLRILSLIFTLLLLILIYLVSKLDYNLLKSTIDELLCQPSKATIKLTTLDIEIQKLIEQQNQSNLSKRDSNGRNSICLSGFYYRLSAENQNKFSRLLASQKKEIPAKSSNKPEIPKRQKKAMRSFIALSKKHREIQKRPIKNRTQVMTFQDGGNNLIKAKVELKLQKLNQKIYHRRKQSGYTILGMIPEYVNQSVSRCGF